MLPATYGFFSAMVKVEKDEYDPIEMATKAWPFQLTAAVFGILTIALFAWLKMRATG